MNEQGFIELTDDLGRRVYIRADIIGALTDTHKKTWVHTTSDSIGMIEVKDTPEMIFMKMQQK